ncbi:hypothetical protein FG386_001033 [Cryptosporidium ryanae]|uniref:uncharacterized protein n=1 Tax=Cryptosporidium ryanae TaxID=515981 RepID=UPI00351A25C9|nr:hypothetical protein FG386_001033 [Cryptosporidium ryanae]
MNTKSNKVHNSEINGNAVSHIKNTKDKKMTIIPNTTIYKILRAFICFTLFSLSILYLIFSCSYAVEYRPLIFDNILTETIKGTIKGTNGEYIQWIATIPTGLVSRTVSIICVVMFLIFGVYTFIFSFYTICKKYRFIQPWYFILLSTISCVGGLISIFLSNKFDIVREFTGLEDCPIQSIVSNDCSTALSNDEIYAYDLCKAVESFCINEHSSMSGYYTKSIIVSVFSFFVTFIGFAYGILLLKLKIKYSKKLALSEKNGIFDSTKTQIELSNQKHGDQYENKDIVSNDLKSKSSANSSTKPNTLYCQNSIESNKMIGSFKNELKPLPMGIVVTTTTTKQCHGPHSQNVEIPQFINRDDQAIGCVNSLKNNSSGCLNSAHNNGSFNFVHNHHHHGYHHHHHHHHAHNPNHIYKHNHH